MYLWLISFCKCVSGNAWLKKVTLEKISQPCQGSDCLGVPGCLGALIPAQVTVGCQQMAKCLLGWSLTEASVNGNRCGVSACPGSYLSMWDLLASLISYSLITWRLILWIPLNAYLVPQTLQIFLVIKQVRRGIEMPSLQGARPSQTSNFCFLEKKWFQCSQWDRFRFRCFHCCVPRL